MDSLALVTVPSLVNLCVDVIATALFSSSNLAGPLCRVNEPELALATYASYNRMRAQHEHAGGGSDGRHLAVLRLFSVFWRPQRLVMAFTAAGGDSSCGPLSELSLFGTTLQHLELRAPGMRDLLWMLRPSPGAGPARAPAAANGAAPLAALTCLSLRGANGLDPASLSVLQHLPLLSSLDLSEASQLDDTCAPMLAALLHLQVLDISGTGCGDATVEGITYGARLAAWSERFQQAPPEAASAWPRSRVHRWHLARTRVTSACVDALSSMPRVTFLDVRGTAVRRWALQPLELRFKLQLVQGAVLSQSNALAAAAVNHGLFVCVAEHAAEGAPRLAAWEREGVAELVDTAQHVQDAEQQRGEGSGCSGVAAGDACAGGTDMPGVPWLLNMPPPGVWHNRSPNDRPEGPTPWGLDSRAKEGLVGPDWARSQCAGGRGPSCPFSCCLPAPVGGCSGSHGTHRQNSVEGRGSGATVFPAGFVSTPRQQQWDRQQQQERAKRKRSGDSLQQPRGGWG